MLTPIGGRRVFLDAGSSQRLRRAVWTDAFVGMLAREILSRSARLCEAPPLTLMREPERETILPTSRELMRRILTHGVAHLLDGHPARCASAVRDLVVAAHLPDWNPAHFLDTAEMCAATAIGVAWFGPFMPAGTRDLVLDSLVDKGLRPGLAGLEGDAFWARCAHNWNVVCCGALLVAAVALRDQAAMADLCRTIADKAGTAIRSGLASFAPDGSWPEGPTYWDYAARYAALAAAALRWSGAEVGMPAGLSRGWRYARHMTGPTGLLFDYGDSVLRPDRSPVLGWLAEQDAGAAALQRQGTAETIDPLDLLFPGREPAGGYDEELRATFPDGALAVFRSDLGPDALYVAMKGGSNAANHAHHDLGTFVLEAGGQRFVEDLGREDYAAPGYFDPAQRPSFTRVSSAAHNIVLVGKRDQSPLAEAPLRSSSLGEDVSVAVFEIVDPAAPVHHQRGVAMVGQAVVVADELAPRQPAEDITAIWRIHTAASLERRGDGLFLKRGDAILHMRVVSPAGAAVEAHSIRFRPGERAAPGVTRLQIAPVRVGERCRIAVVFSMDDPAPDALALAEAPLEAWCRPASRAPGPQPRDPGAGW